MDIQPKFYLWDDTTIYPMHALHPQLLFNAELSSLGYRAKAVSFYDSIQVTNNNNLTVVSGLAASHCLWPSPLPMQMVQTDDP